MAQIFEKIGSREKSKFIGGNLIARKALILEIILSVLQIQSTYTSNTFSFTLSCTSTQYEQWSAFQCKDCGTNQVAVNSNSYCGCSSGSIISGDVSSTAYTCATCASGEKASYFDSTCKTSATCSTGQIYQKIATNGAENTSFSCLTCSTNAYPWNWYSPGDNFMCRYCPPNQTRQTNSDSCSCSNTTLNDICVDTTTWTSQQTSYSVLAGTSYQSVTYYSLESGTSDLTVNSYVMSCYFQEAAYLCFKEENIKYCQVLANLCVLTLYNMAHPACSIYNTVMLSKSSITNATDSYHKENLPWLLYDSNYSNAVKVDTINFTVSYVSASIYSYTTNSNVSTLPLYLARYSLDGTLYDVVVLRSELIMCHGTDYTMSYTFGISYRNSCSINLQNLIGTHTDQFFYELFVKDTDSSQTFIDVPVQIKNYRASDGSYPNKSSSSSNWKLVRRFFTVDKVSGVESATSCDNILNTTPSSVQYLKEARLEIISRSSNASKIYKPLLVLEYAYHTSNTSTSTYKTVSFKTTYNQTFSSFWIGTIIGYFVVLVIVILVVVCKLMIWTKFNYHDPTKPEEVEQYKKKRCNKILLATMGMWTLFTWLFMLLICFYWFIEFKSTNTVNAVYPTSSAYMTQEAVFSVMFVIQTIVSVIYLFQEISHQSKIDLLFIDWEKPKFFLKRKNTWNLVRSAWRTLFIGNEYSELTLESYQDSAQLLCIVGVMLVGFKLENVSKVTPNFTIKNVENVVQSPILEFFFYTLVMLAVGSFLILFRRLVSYWFPTSLVNFMDQCSVANVSCIFFTGVQNGYYIHGQNPNASADGTMKEQVQGLNNYIQKRTEGRGLDPTERINELQTFEIFIPIYLRKKYDEVLLQAMDIRMQLMDKYKKTNQKATPPPKPEADKQQDEKKNEEAQEKLGDTTHLINAQKTMNNVEEPIEGKLEQLENKKRQLNKLFKDMITGAKMKKNSVILEKSFGMQFFGLAPRDDLQSIETPLFFKDFSYGYKFTALFGINFRIQMTHTQVFNTFNYVFGSIPTALMLTYQFEQILVWYRESIGEENISDKTLIDDRFLI